VRDTAIFLSMEHDLEAPNIVPLTVEGTAKQGWLVVFKGYARRLAKLPGSAFELPRLTAWA
jgi:hypothetical protein